MLVVQKGRYNTHNYDKERVARLTHYYFYLVSSYLFADELQYYSLFSNVFIHLACKCIKYVFQ